MNIIGIIKIVLLVVAIICFVASVVAKKTYADEVALATSTAGAFAAMMLLGFTIGGSF